MALGQTALVALTLLFVGLVPSFDLEGEVS